MKLFGLVLLASCMVIAYGESAPKQSTFYRLAYFNNPAKVRAIESLGADLPEMENGDYDEMEEDDSQMSSRQTSASTGRLFFRRLFQNQNPVIPIIITGTGGGSAPTSTGTIPTASGTITTTPSQRGLNINDEYGIDGVPSEDEEALQAAVAPGGIEYAATEPDIKGTGLDGGQNKLPPRVNKRRNGNNGKVVTVRVPQKYRKYFKNGQKVYLRSPPKRRNMKNRNRRRKINN